MMGERETFGEPEKDLNVNKLCLKTKKNKD